MVRAPNNSTRNVYVQGLRINGRRWNKTYLPHSMLANGATLTFDMGPRPSGWATHGDTAPPSLTEGREPARPLRDATGKHGGEATSSTGDDVVEAVRRQLGHRGVDRQRGSSTRSTGGVTRASTR